MPRLTLLQKCMQYNPRAQLGEKHSVTISGFCSSLAFGSYECKMQSVGKLPCSGKISFTRILILLGQDICMYRRRRQE